jgi:hypothetical protein
MNKVNYSALELERNSEVREDLEAIFKRKETGSLNTLRGIVLTHILQSNYDLALKEIEGYAEDKKEFPAFKIKAHRYITHCRDLIAAIQGKRELQGLSALPAPKQKDMFEKIVDHYEELKKHVRQIEAIGHETYLDDIRSTVIVLKVTTYCVITVLFVALTLDLFGNIFITYNNVALDVSGDFTSWLFDFIGI